MKADITYWGGASYRMHGKAFYKGRVVTVSDDKIIKRAQTTRGFVVHLHKEDPPEPEKQTEPEDPTEEVPRKKKRLKKILRTSE